jgi:hypothetical protein
MAIDKRRPQSKKKKRLLKKRELASRPRAVGRYLIVCEGERTEPLYFEWFKRKFDELKSSSVQVKSTEGLVVKSTEIVDDIKTAGVGKNTITLVEHAIKLRDKANPDYSDVWCVFDKDSFPESDFNNAITKAQANDIGAAYSNEAFELWYLLHYHYYNTPIDREQYKKMLTPLLGKEYQKNNPSMYEDLMASGGNQEKAIGNAQRLLNNSSEETPAKSNPSTTVHLLVESLNKFLQDFEDKLKRLD